MPSRFASAACSSIGLYGTGTGTAETRRTWAFKPRNVSGSSAIRAAISEGLVEFSVGPGQTKRSVIRGSAHAAAILAALGITDLDPPTPPPGAPTVML